MAAEAIELATAFVTIVPSMQGSQGALARDLIPEGESAGDAAGNAAGGRFSSSMKRVMGGAALFAGVVVAAKGLYEIGAVFDDVADTIQIGTGASGEALDGLVESAKNVGATVPAAFEDIGPVVADVNTRLGLTGDTLETVAGQYLQAGKILGETIDIDTTSAAFSVFKIEGDAVVGAMDTLFQVSQATGVGMNELATSVQGAGPAMQALGFSFEETTALVGSLDKAGLDSTGTLAAMSKGLVNLAKDGEEPQEAFRRVTGELEGLITSGDTAAAIDLASGIFGSKAAVGFVGAVESGTLALDDLVGGVGATSDTILGVAGDTADFAETWQLLKNKATLALEPLGTKVFNLLGESLEKAMPYFESLANWLTDNTWALGVLVGLVGVGLVGAFIALVAPIWATTVAMLANPVTWIVLGIVALIAALIALAANWDTVSAWISDVWGSFTTWLSESLSSIGGWFSDTWDGIWAFLVQWGPKFLIALTGPIGWLVAYLVTNWDSISATVVQKWTGILDWIKGIPGWFVDRLAALGNLAATVGGWIGGVKDAAVQKFTDMVTWVTGIPGSIKTALGSMGTLLSQAGKDIISGLWAGLTSKFEDVKKWVNGVGTWIADHKGPRAYDLALLQPAGGWIMTGLQRGLSDAIPDLERTLGQVTSAIQVGVPGKINLGVSGAQAIAAAGLAGDTGARGGHTFQITETSDPRSTAMTVVRQLSMAGV